MARAKIKIVGLGKRMTGVSKVTNTPYDFTEVNFTYPDKFVNGCKAANSAVDQSLLEGIELQVGKEYDCFYHVVKGKTYVDGILKV